MNKKLFLGMFAAATMLFATSCQNDELDAVQAGNEATVSFNLGVEGGVQTRAISDGSGANWLEYAVFDKDGNRLTGIEKVKKDVSRFPTNETITLAKGQTYKVAFWAQNKECSAYSVDDYMNLRIDYAGDNNDEKRDAFFKTIEFTVTGNNQIDVVMKRPFAQLNVGVTTDDWTAAKASGVTVANSKVEISNVASTMDLIDGTVDGKTNLTYGLAEIPTQKLSVNDVDYYYLSMSYLLVDAKPTGTEKATLESVKFTFDSDGADIVLEEGLNAVPVRRNWRTNIIGQILTGDVKFNISIDPIYDGDYNKEDDELKELPVELNGTYYTTIEEALAVAVDGSTINLAAGEYTLPYGGITTNTWKRSITFAGEGENTVVKGNSYGDDQLEIVMKNLTYKATKTSYETDFLHAKSVTYENCTIIGQYYAQGLATHIFKYCTIDPQDSYLFTYGANCKFDGCTFNSSKGKALQVFSDVGTESTVIIANCIFEAEQTATTSSGKPVSAIDINSTNGHKFTVNISNTIATGYATGEYSGSSLWNIKGGAENVTVTIDGAKPSVELNGKYHSTIEAAIANAADDESLDITLAEGTYSIPQKIAKGKTLSFTGTSDVTANTIIDCNDAGLSLDGSTVKFKNLTIKTKGGNNQGFIRMAGTYENCRFENLYFTMDGKHEFKNCEFNVYGTEEHCVWTYGANDVDFENCTFNYVDRCVNVFTYTVAQGDIAFKNCSFNAVNSNSKGAVEINSGSYTESVKVDFNGCNGPAHGELVFISTWDKSKGAKATVTIDNAAVTPEIK